jgi:hypothetical protein
MYACVIHLHGHHIYLYYIRINIKYIYMHIHTEHTYNVHSLCLRVCSVTDRSAIKVSHTHARTRTCTHACTYTRPHAHMHTRMCACTHARCVRKCARTRIRAFFHIFRHLHLLRQHPLCGSKEETEKLQTKQAPSLPVLKAAIDRFTHERRGQE